MICVTKETPSSDKHDPLDDFSIYSYDFHGLIHGLKLISNARFQDFFDNKDKRLEETLRNLPELDLLHIYNYPFLYIYDCFPPKKILDIEDDDEDNWLNFFHQLI